MQVEHRNIKHIISVTNVREPMNLAPKYTLMNRYYCEILVKQHFFKI